jgi:signal transduction histidine kinase/ActR/RegA family two-component response regulator
MCTSIGSHLRFVKSQTGTFCHFLSSWSRSAPTRFRGPNDEPNYETWEPRVIATVNQSRFPLRFVSLVVLLALVGATVGLTIAVQAIVRGEQQSLLRDKASEGSLLLSTLFAGTQSTLPILVADSSLQVGDTADFEQIAASTLGTAATIGALRVTNGQFALLAQVGTGIGSAIGADRAALADRALSGKGVVTGIVTTPQGSRMSMALAAGPDKVVFEDLYFDPKTPLSLGKIGPLNDINGALYDAPNQNAADLVLTTTNRLPLSGPTSHEMVKVGNDNLLLVVKAKSPLVGSLTSNAPWAVLAAGLAIAALTTFGIEALGRRRVYALGLVDARTAELREALDQQRRLEQDERSARQAAETANRSKSEFLSRMSHELRTPLNAVLGFGQLLELDGLTETQSESVQQIVKGGRHLLELINEVLDISRIETGNLALSPEPVLVDDVIADALSLMRPLAEHRAITLASLTSPAGAAHVLADRQRLNQILINLISNAIKYNHEGGTVTVTSEHHRNNNRSGDTVRISVADTGPGIAAADLPRLFVPFERLGAERTATEGTGVGLALSRRLAEAMGGTLEVSSTESEGSRFWVELAAVEGPLERYERRLHRSEPDHAGDRDRPARKILYIEDNLSNVRLVERIFSRRGDTELISAMQGRIGISLAQEHHPHLILVDLHLPDINGEEVLRQLRADPETADTPIVVLSADATVGSIDRLHASGATAYLTKPIDVQALLALLDTILPAIPTGG